MGQSIQSDIDVASIALPLPEVLELFDFCGHILDLYLAQGGIILLAQSVEVHDFRYVKTIPLRIQRELDLQFLVSFVIIGVERSFEESSAILSFLNEIMLFKLSELAVVQLSKVNGLIHMHNLRHYLSLQFLLVGQLREWTLAKDLKLLSFDGISHHFVVLSGHLLEFSVEVLSYCVSAVAHQG